TIGDASTATTITDINANEVTFTQGGTSGHVRIVTLTVNYSASAEAPAVEAPVFSVEKGTHYNPFSVEIAAEEGATVYYTLDGTEPTAESTEYTEAIAINKFGTTVTVKAAAVVEGEWSNVASATYSLKVAAPEFSIKGGVYEKLTGANALQFTTETEGATIYYNNRGGNPIEAGSKSYGSLSVLSTAEVKAVAFVEVDGEKIYSDVTSEKYYISPVKPFKKATEFAAGEYVMYAENIIATALSETGNYGYLPKIEVTVNGNFIETNEFYAFTFTEVEGGYTIQDTFGRYVYMTGTYNSFNVAEEMPAEGAVWTVAIDETTGEATITNVTMNKYIQYSAQYKSFGSYASAQNNGFKPALFAIGEYPTLTVTPANWETIPCFDKVTITCESGIQYNETDDVYPYYNIGWDYTPYEFDNVNVIDENTIELSFNTPIEDNGDYRVVLPAGLFILDPNGLAISSEEKTANYTVENLNVLEVAYANPDNGSTVKSIEYLYFEFNQNIVDNVSDAVITNENGDEFPLTVTYTDSWGEQTPYTALCLKASEPITTPGVYTFVLKKQFVCAEANANVTIAEDLTYTFTITEGLKIVSVSPVAGAEVSAIDEIIIECNQDVQCWAEGFLVMDENETEYFFAPTFTDKDGNELPYNMIRLVTETPITAAGKYTLYVEDYNIANTDWMNQEVLPAQTFVFEFDGSKITTGIDEVKGENGEVKTIFDLTGRKVKEITAPGIYIVNGKKILVK
ncbi:MAG: chitobiase/beta-hexosaminidase C-terminal domain-containing protein, partial [Bacteroidaceae bacterium]|nr:chitobiase/beta-hexosaminidase C-terminal domain-containing protein [Bacteroidaceae bacterium]